MSLLATVINDYIKSRGITIGYFAEQVGASHNTVTRWLQGKHWPQEHIKAIQRVLALSENQFLLIAQDWRLNGHGQPKYRVAGSQYVSQQFGGSYQKFVEAVLSMERNAFMDIPRSLAGAPDKWAPIFRATTDLWRVIVRDDTIVGIWQFIGMLDEYVDDLKAGRLAEDEISIDMLHFTHLPGRYRIYSPAIAIHSDDLNPATRRLIYNSILQVVRESAADGIFFSEFVAVAASPQGEQLCKDVGMSRHGSYESDATASIYALHASNLNRSPLAKDLIIRKQYEREFSCVRGRYPRT